MTILDNFLKLWTIFDKWKDSLGDSAFETLSTILTIENLNSDNHSYLTVNCDTGQHSQFLRCFNVIVRSVIELESLVVYKEDFERSVSEMLYLQKNLICLFRNGTLFLGMCHHFVPFCHMLRLRCPSHSWLTRA